MQRCNHFYFFFSSRRRHTRSLCDWSSDVCSSDLNDGSYPRSPRSLPQVTTVVTPGNPQETVIQDTDSQETVIQEGTYGANAPTPADLSSEELHEKVDGAIIGVETVKRITDKHKAVYATNETPNHIAGAAIGNDAEEETPTEKREAVKIGATHGNDTTVHPGPGMGHNHGEHHPEAHEQITSEHTPGAGALPSAADPFFGRHGNTSDQAISVSPSLDSEPAQADFPPAGSAASGATTAQASGFVPPKRPRGKQATQALSLMGSEVMQWIAEIRGAKPRMTAGNVRACNALAECDGMSKEALAAYFASIEAQNREVDLLTAAGETGNDKVGFLSFESNWPKLKKKLKGQSPEPAKEPGTSGFDIYKGNGPEEREQALRDYEERKANGTLIW